MCQSIPFLGGLIAAVLNLIHLIPGSYATHETTGGKAAVAVLLPIFLSILLCGVAVFFAYSTLVGAAATTASVLAGG